jgi:cyclopropane fatty-acyl-phospholipid synthase-like methyltransferase
MTQESGSRDRDPDSTSWSAYYRHTAGREPRPLFTKGMAAVEAAGMAPGQAVEIGFGDGTETLALIGAGWRVTAIDPTPEAATGLRAKVREEDAARLTIISAPAQEVELPPFDLLYAGYALPFIPRAALTPFFGEMRRALHPGGLLVVNLFGVRDSWFGKPEMTFVDIDEARSLVDGLEVVAFDEEDADGNSFLGPKHWHVFDIIARCPDEAPG